MNFNIIYIIIVTLFISACSAKKNNSHSKSLVGVSSKEVIDEKGQPDTITDGRVNTESTIYTYPEETFQIMNDKVTTHFRTPEKKEIKLQYWMHKWQEVYEKRIIENPKDKDHKSDSTIIEYRSQEKISIIYDKDADIVVRVVYYE